MSDIDENENRLRYFWGFKMVLSFGQMYLCFFHMPIDSKFARHSPTHRRQRTPAYNLKKAFANEAIFRLRF